MNQIELYLPDCQKITTELAGWCFLFDFATKSEWGLDFDSTLNHYFFDANNQLTSSVIPHGALCAYFCDVEQYPEQLYWMKADCVQYILDMNKGFVMPGTLRQEEFYKTKEMLNKFLHQDGVTYYIVDEKNGLISSKKNIQYYAPNVLDIINRPISFDKFSGEDKSYWQKLGAELQLLLRQNKIQESSPEGLYFWGTGRLPEKKLNFQYSQVFSNHYSVLGLAKLSNIFYQKINNDTDMAFNLSPDKKNKILWVDQEFSLYWRTQDNHSFSALLIYYNKILLELIELLKKNQLHKIVVNTGKNRYQLTRVNIIQSYFLRFFKFKLKKRKNGY